MCEVGESLLKFLGHYISFPQLSNDYLWIVNSGSKKILFLMVDWHYDNKTFEQGARIIIQHVPHG